ncbi:EamA family transporter [Stutzerimonas azotifigens]|uniref:EamA family transporter n=1 Tax=Stutzerimonas azotifigens TaxID=291995 RepID=UPI00041D1BF9|nr:DMT family transporter [Stutzerimonas azotifigens]
MIAHSTPASFPRHVAVLILLCIGCTLASNHIAARIAFDSGAGVVLAVLCRSGVTFLALATLLTVRRQPIRLAPGAWRWQLLLGLLIGVQSLCLYSAVARVPVALALLVANLFPILLALLTWGLGGPRPTPRAAMLMGLILFGLVLALDVPARLGGERPVGSDWLLGIGLAFVGATVFACALWVTDHKLSGMPGAQRSMLTMMIAFGTAAALGAADLLPGGLNVPGSTAGWTGLVLLTLFYGAGFSVLFVLIPRLDMPRNAPVMNMEPVATLVLGWIVLGQTLSPVQILGGLVVVTGIVILATHKLR